MTRGLSYSEARGIFPDQGSNPCLLHGQADSLPLGLLRVGAARGTNKYKYKAGFESTEKVKEVSILMGERIKDCFK